MIADMARSAAGARRASIARGSTQYLDSVREVERRIQRAEQASADADHR